jgi:hypothetical protein
VVRGAVAVEVAVSVAVLFSVAVDKVESDGVVTTPAEDAGFACVIEAMRVPAISPGSTARTAQVWESLHFAMTAAPSSSFTQEFKTET